MEILSTYLDYNNFNSKLPVFHTINLKFGTHQVIINNFYSHICTYYDMVVCKKVNVS